MLILGERMIEQVLINLVKNAVEAMRTEKSRSIILSGKRNNSHLIIAVRDSGTGIPEEQLESIFIPFYSTSSSGSGIGLSFSQHVMRLHSGHINVLSNPGKGSEFQLVFKTT